MATYTVPAGVTSIKVECWGAGHGGAGGWFYVFRNLMNTSYYTKGGSGGVGGSYAKATLAVTPGDTYTYNIGTGGAGGVAGWYEGGAGAGDVGGDTYFSTLVVAAGGGSSSSNVGDITYIGGNGFAVPGGMSNYPNGGGGGSSAGTASNGTAGTYPTGGTAPTGGGDGGTGSAGTGGIGGTGTAPGGGGGGGLATFTGGIRTRAGGPGADGQITITEVITANPDAQAAVLDVKAVTLTYDYTEVLAQVALALATVFPVSILIDTNLTIIVPSIPAVLALPAPTLTYDMAVPIAASLDLVLTLEAPIAGIGCTVYPEALALTLTPHFLTNYDINLPEYWDIRDSAGCPFCYTSDVPTGEV